MLIVFDHRVKGPQSTVVAVLRSACTQAYARQICRATSTTRPDDEETTSAIVLHRYGQRSDGDRPIFKRTRPRRWCVRLTLQHIIASHQSVAKSQRRKRQHAGFIHASYSEYSIHIYVRNACIMVYIKTTAHLVNSAIRRLIYVVMSDCLSARCRCYGCLVERKCGGSHSRRLHRCSRHNRNAPRATQPAHSHIYKLLLMIGKSVEHAVARPFVAQQQHVIQFHTFSLVRELS